MYKISVQYSYGRYEILIYELLNKYAIIEDHCCGHEYIICFTTNL